MGEPVSSSFRHSNPDFNVWVLRACVRLACTPGLRVAGITEILPASRALVMSQSWIYIALIAVVPFVYVINFINSLITRKIRWRTVEYELMSPNETRITGY